MQMGRILLVQKKEKDALAKFEKALSLQPNYIEPLQYIVSVYMSRKEYRKAFDRAAQQLPSAPNNPFLYAMLGSLYEANKDVNNAEVYMKKAIDLNPGLPALQVSLANFYMRQNMVGKAKNEYLATVQKSPDSLPAHMALGMIYESE
jgi:tetratricopeptide (TPR) repeat protein